MTIYYTTVDKLLIMYSESQFILTNDNLLYNCWQIDCILSLFILTNDNSLYNCWQIDCILSLFILTNDNLLYNCWQINCIILTVYIYI
jgi:hypothetical protein